MAKTADKTKPEPKPLKTAQKPMHDPRVIAAGTVIDILNASFEHGRRQMDGIYFCCGVGDYDSRHARYPAEITMYSGKPGKGKPVGTVRVNLRKDCGIGPAALRKAASEIAGLATVAAARAKPKADLKAKGRKAR